MSNGPFGDYGSVVSMLNWPYIDWDRLPSASARGGDWMNVWLCIMHGPNILYYPFTGNLGRLTWVKGYFSRKSSAIPSPTIACWVFSCFRNPPNSDMDYRIFNVRM